MTTTLLILYIPQYQIVSLKAFCATHLASKIDTESAVEMLLLADLHQAIELKDVCLDFIAKNSAQVVATEGWEKIELGNNTKLLSEVIKRMAPR